MERQVRFYDLWDGEVRSRGGHIHFTKKFDLLGGPANRCDACGCRVETRTYFQQFCSAGEIAGIESSELQISNKWSADEHPCAFSDLQQTERLHSRNRFADRRSTDSELLRQLVFGGE